MKSPITSLLMLFVFVLTSCGTAAPSTNSTEHISASVEQSQEKAPPLVSIDACAILTAEKIATVYKQGTFVVENKQTYPSTAYEALSVCRYQMKNVEFKDNYHVDLEVRVKSSPKDAKEALASMLAMDIEKKATSIEGIGDEAYYFNYSMAYDGPYVLFTKENTLYKLKVQSIKTGVMNTVEGELLSIAKLLLSNS